MKPIAFELLNQHYNDTSTDECDKNKLERELKQMIFIVLQKK